MDPRRREREPEHEPEEVPLQFFQHAHRMAIHGGNFIQARNFFDVRVQVNIDLTPAAIALTAISTAALCLF
ncbi:hypothetical protein CC1G_10896 [Coprinopsis cinerea okayama7|uniref:Uncharacterized protein n=1 Tax=Coprinopsis cinerea (strain Okayama-7 / 130 / ATCC MYA-4618 / FGSC 9003) TaxID=240176 RepID=A8P5V8_COPC7|nr:hypothetical protein CC1G_10896 [Coprinopsis cinerea okayama7\|eukprot:XP_001839033.2 hypothetical protein CC1G_10896 [Coprinopsis cinerea okayama7\